MTYFFDNALMLEILVVTACFCLPYDIDACEIITGEVLMMLHGMIVTQTAWRTDPSNQEPFVRLISDHSYLIQAGDHVYEQWSNIQSFKLVSRLLWEHLAPHLLRASSSQPAPTASTHHHSLPQVYREVAVFENMNPGGGYSSRIQQLGTFACSVTKPQQGLLCEDINDPLYGNSGGAQERTALLAAVHELRIACRGLLQKLMHLQSR